MSIIQRLRDAAIHGPVPCLVANEAVDLLEEIQGYLIAAHDGSMSRNNSEHLAGELLDAIDKID